MTDTGVSAETDWWARVGRLIETGRRVQWELGDLLVVGRHEFGFTWADVADRYNYSAEHLRDLEWVANKVKPDCRRDDLAWSTHRAVGTLTPQQQKYWLRKAAEHRWPERELRHQVRVKQTVPEGPEKVPTTAEGLCPHCGQPMPV